MTRRERLEQKIEKRAEWAQKAAQRSEQRFNTVHSICEHIPFGQPILVGHHSERHARADQKRIETNMDKACELAKLAEHHQSKAAGLEYQLEKCIFSDDPDALEAIAQRIAANEAKREQMKKVNALYRKGDAAGLKALGIDYETLKAKLAAMGAYWGSAPHMAYELTNLGARIRTDKQRLEAIKRRQQTVAKAEESAHGVILQGTGDYVSVTFAEKPARGILDELKAAGFYWGRGSWSGRRNALPASVTALLEETVTS